MAIDVYEWRFFEVFGLPPMCDMSHMNFRDVLHTSVPRVSTVAPMDNDGLHKFAYRRREFFADLMRLAVPALAAELDFARAELLPTSSVAAAGDRLEQRHGDMAWRVPQRRGAGRPGSQRPDLIVVVEFQSTVDQGMAERMREYCRRQRESDVAGRAEDDRPALLLPLVVYNGSERWTAPGAVVELPAPRSTAAHVALAPFQAWDYVLVSLERLLAAGGGLARLPPANRSAATMRLQAERTPADLLARLREEWARFPGVADRATREVLHAWAGALLADMAGADTAGAESALPTMDELEGSKGGTEMTTVSQARLGKWFEEFRAENVAQGVQLGIEQGIQQGMEQGVRRGIEQGVQRGIEQGVQQERARGLARLRRHAAIKFGAQTAERLAALLGAAIAVEQMERVGDWIVECDRGGDLLARVSAMRANGGDGS